MRLFNLFPIAKPKGKAIQLGQALRPGEMEKTLPAGHRWCVSGKMDGIRAQLHKSGHRVQIMSDEARVVEESKIRPIIKDAIKIYPETAVVDGELMMFVNGRNQHHQGIVSYIPRHAYH